MNFEEALVVEFDSISLITGKVFPLYTGEGIDPPFLVYVSSEGLYDRTLTEFFQSKTIECEIHIVGNDYEELKTIEREVIAKIISFSNRQLGGTGPLIKSVGYDQPEEMYEGETNLYRASFDMRVRI
jgi:hypothetical protein